MKREERGAECRVEPETGDLEMCPTFRKNKLLKESVFKLDVDVSFSHQKHFSGFNYY